jgi:Glycosyltransferase family 87
VPRWLARLWPGPWQRPSPWLLVLAAVGAIFLAVVAATAWPIPADEGAYWGAAERLVDGEALYDPSAAPNTPYAYWYPPVLAQVLAPLTLVIPQAVFTILWTLLVVGCVWVLAGRNVFVALACVAFLPVALELRVRNVHLIIALLTVLAIRRSWAFWIPATALKLAPGLGAVYLLASGRRREALLVIVVGAAVAALSVVVSPDAWAGFAAVAAGRAPSDGGTFVPIPYVARLAAGAALAVAAGRVGGTRGEVMLVVAITVASPTLWGNAFSQLLAILPLLRNPRPEAQTTPPPVTRLGGTVGGSGGEAG